MKYIIFLNYSSELEKKRVNYYLNKWRGEIKIEEPKMAFLVDIDEKKIDVFIKGLLSKISHSDAEARLKSRIFKVDREVKYDSDTESTSVYEFPITEEEAEKMINLIMARLKGVLYDVEKGILRYKVNTKKGFALVEAHIRQKDKKYSIIWFRIVGFGEVVEFVKEKIEKEIELMGDVYGQLQSTN
ncbi:MAG: hypothetical protein GXN95_00930 [Methanococci archaeon]|nr:hypothetical protein [Methanococci archaeon]